MNGVATLLARCRLYDFEGNEKWRSYQANLELPAGRDATALIQKFKAKWYQREIVSLDQELARRCPAASTNVRAQPRRLHAQDESFDPALVQAEATAQASDTAFKPTPQAPTGMALMLCNAKLTLVVQYPAAPLNFTARLRP